MKLVILAFICVAGLYEACGHPVVEFKREFDNAGGVSLF